MKPPRKTHPQAPLYYGDPLPVSAVPVDAVTQHQDAITISFPQVTGQLGEGQILSRATVAVTTASLVDGETVNGVIALGKSSLVLRFEGTCACRIRLYSTAAYRTADAPRTPGTDPTGEHGLMLDIVLPVGDLIWDLSPLAAVTNEDGPATSNIYYAIQNLSGAPAAVTATLTRILLEA